MARRPLRSWSACWCRKARRRVQLTPWGKHPDPRKRAREHKGPSPVALLGGFQTCLMRVCPSSSTAPAGRDPSDSLRALMACDPWDLLLGIDGRIPTPIFQVSEVLFATYSKPPSQPSPTDPAQRFERS